MRDRLGPVRGDVRGGNCGNDVLACLSFESILRTADDADAAAASAAGLRLLAVHFIFFFFFCFRLVFCFALVSYARGEVHSRNMHSGDVITATVIPTKVAWRFHSRKDPGRPSHDGTASISKRTYVNNALLRPSFFFLSCLFGRWLSPS